ncbi:hypothetical protein N7499_006674 [Penicillium canescens]|uniref:Uncharacterized protein n=1 Tax=Penicillium canescens TaxID=5083 RepID=A0AAD6NAP4_PENCN|nr:uncharacterized protein N7446_002366 [Penicillium canescens]KAJ5997010.1 hypothetical protein N7522_008670 [Penicillium canescens]KAJ6044170.1 hypothetical protein N7460_005525 [Penicillium canescens]KAJ6055640.1 hypothetical protein N7444_004738 [Penicillium canescens]KAJ6074589.1 hypothetical protein N7446_002366 [Penicillium canescens]KAJ6081800.1 hypothetical protein N7499_006674 [Penicillium canescens]
MSSSTSPKPNRPRLIPNKRPLKPTSTTNRYPRVLNPSANPAETRLKQSYQEYLQTRKDNPNPSSTPATEEDDLPQIPRIEVPFSAPQPFLDPLTWDAMLRLHREKIAAQSVEDSNGATSQGSGSGVGASAVSGEESAERRRQRAEQEMEYGSMAIRGRSSVRGRGKRGRGRGNIYWGGRS